MNEAIQLMLIGMSTVFVVLGIIVLLGRGVISLSNRFEVQVAEKRNVQRHAVSPATLAILSAVVDHESGGRARISKVEPLD